MLSNTVRSEVGGTYSKRPQREPYSWISARGETNPLCEEILKEKNIMIAGTVGSGKTTLEKAVLHTGFTKNIHWVYLDFKGSELKRFAKAPNCIGYAAEPETAIPLLNDIINIMMGRFRRMEQKDIDVSDEPPIWIVVDETAEFSDLCGTEGLNLLARIGRMGRAAEIHMMLCTQNPSRGKGGGLPSKIMQNITAAIALRCRASIESRQIIGQKGAEELPKYGKGYFWNADGTRLVDIPYIPNEVIVERLKQVVLVD